jgi:hypothetical protein
MLIERGGGPVTTASLSDGDRVCLPPARVRQNARMASTGGEAGCVFCDIVAGRRPGRG